MTKQHVGHLIKSINEKLKAKADLDAKEHNLTLSQSFVLTFLDNKGGQATQKEIEKYLDVSHPAVVGIISRMEQNHHVTCWMDPNDKRIKMVSLTPQAKTLVNDMSAMCLQWENNMLAGFSAEEIETLKELLSRVNDNMIKIQGR